MKKDFTFEMYEKLLEAGLDAEYEHLTVRDYCSCNELPKHFIIHRHDVDRKPKNALKMAKIERDHGISSTYYFRTIKNTFKPDIISKIDSLGHEIGYHYEDLDRAGGDIKNAIISFEKELERLRQITKIETICMHGNSLRSWNNKDMWKDISFESYDLLGEAYLSIDFMDVEYFSDTGRTWKDTEIGPLFYDFSPVIYGDTKNDIGKNYEADTTWKIIDLISSSQIDRMCILSHPNRWADNRIEWHIEHAKDSLTNSAKFAIRLYSMFFNNLRT